MVSLKRIVGAILLLIAGYFVMSCDDFFSPTIEIFHKIDNPNKIKIDQDHEQNQKQKKSKSKNNTDTMVIGGQEYIVN
jgi:hypothetical protein